MSDGSEEHTPESENLSAREEPAPHIENIEILELIARGGMSVIYKAKQKQLDRLVAVKVLAASAIGGEEGIRRFQSEAKLTSSLLHSNIVKIISFGVSSSGQAYMVMEYLEGTSLSVELKQHGRITLQRFRDLFIPLLSALQAAHEAGLVHRDIKPGNIMLCRDESGAESVKLVDFGIAKLRHQSLTNDTETLTSPGSLIGTPTYMSPEQCQGKTVDGRSDLYSLACVMFETIVGSPPFTGNSALEIMHKHHTEELPTISGLNSRIDISPELAKTILWGMTKDPDARPQTAQAFSKALNEALEGTTLNKVPVLKSVGSPRAKPVVVYILAAIIAGSAGVMILRMQQKDKGNGEAQADIRTQANLYLTAAQAHRQEPLEAIPLYRKAVRELLILQNKTAQDENQLLKAYDGMAEAESYLQNHGNANYNLTEHGRILRQALSQAKKAKVSPKKQAELEYKLALNLSANAATIKEAEELCKASLAKHEKFLEAEKGADKFLGADTGVRHALSRVAACRTLLGFIYEFENRPKEAVVLLKRSFSENLDCNGEFDVNTLWSLERLCRAQYCAGDRAGEKQALEDFLQRIDGIGDANLRDALLADLYKFYEDKGAPDLQKKVQTKIAELKKASAGGN